LTRSKEVIIANQSAVTELKELRRQVAESERRIQDKRGSVSQVLPENNEELRLMMANFESTMQNRTQEQRNLQRNVDLLQNEIAQLRASTDELNIKRGQGESLRQSIADSNNKLADECANVARQLDLQPPPPANQSNSSNSPHATNNLKKFINLLQSKV
jgi:DNA repair exonuclease SbcCD ATPase subunit